ncbi:hypothetical protein [Ideonella sp.]|uniref:hypothetical protein n=1 Tax=Ideonella sp. TaxID=1929293 RepID=UPI00351BD42D
MLIALLGVGWLARERLKTPVAVPVAVPTADGQSVRQVPPSQVANEVAKQIDAATLQHQQALERADAGEKP